MNDASRYGRKRKTALEFNTEIQKVSPADWNSTRLAERTSNGRKLTTNVTRHTCDVACRQIHSGNRALANSPRVLDLGFC